MSGPLIKERYKRLELIGEGGDAYVYKVEDLNEPNDSPFRLYVYLHTFKLIEFKMKLPFKKFNFTAKH